LSDRHYHDCVSDDCHEQERLTLEEACRDRCRPLVEALTAAADWRYGWHRLVRDTLRAYHAAQGAGSGT
jgi:hypothetical protein